MPKPRTVQAAEDTTVGVINKEGKKDPIETMLSPYAFHGLSFSMNSKEATSDCLFCGREGKFNVNLEKTTWRCVACNKAGNIYTFLKELHAKSFASTPLSFYETIASLKGVAVSALKRWQVAKHLTSGRACVPGYNAQGKINQLYRDVPVKGKVRLLGTVTLSLGMFLSSKQHACKRFIICEGLYDTICADDAVTNDGRYGDYNVVGVPGARAFSDKWKEYFNGAEEVFIWFDNDWPNQNDGQSSGYEGMKRIAHTLLTLPKPVKSVRVLYWSEAGYSTDYPNGCDVRDLLTGKVKPLIDQDKA